MEKQIQAVKCRICASNIIIDPKYPFANDDICDECLEKSKEDEKIKKRMLYSGMKPKHLEMTFENYRFKDKSIIPVVKDFCAKKEFNLFLHGTPGIGKTHLLSAMANLIIKREHIRFYRTIDLLDKTRSLMISDGVLAADDFISSLSDGKRYVFLDDLGVEKITDTAIEKLYLLFDNIELEKTKGVMLASNYNLTELVVRLGDDRIVDRIIGNFVIKEIKGDSERIKGRKIL